MGTISEINMQIPKLYIFSFEIESNSTFWGNIVFYYAWT